MYLAGRVTSLLGARVVPVLGVAAVVAGFATSAYLWESETRSAQEADERAAVALEAAAIAELNRYTSAFAGASALFVGGEAPSPTLIEVFSSEVLSSTGLPAIAYNAVVDRDLRSDWERRTGVKIRDLTFDGFRDAESRETYWPVAVVTPLTESSKTILGFDIRSNRERRAAAETSLERGATAMSEPIIAQPSGEVAVYFAHAVTRGTDELAGFFTTATQADVLGERISPAARNAAFRLVDVESQALFAWSTTTPVDVEAVRRFEIAGRPIRLEVSDRRGAAHLASFLTLLGTVVVMGFTLQAVRVNRQRRTQIADHQATEHRLVGQLQARVVLQPAHTESWEINAAYAPAHDDLGLGGDWYDVIDHGDASVSIVVGDVAGHGVDAVADMLEFRSGLRSLLAAGVEIQKALHHMDAEARSRSPLQTATLAVLRLDGATVTWALAGHPPPLLITQDEVIRLDAANGGILGAGLSSPRNVETMELPPGALMLLFTDGVIERPGHSLDEAIDALGRSVQRAIDKDLDSLIEEVMSHSSGHDDAACVITRRKVVLDVCVDLTVLDNTCERGPQATA